MHLDCSCADDGAFLRQWVTFFGVRARGVLLSVAAVFSAWSAHAREVPVDFSRNYMAYRAHQGKVSPGDVLVFGNGARFTVGRELGGERSDTIYEIEGRSDAVLRVPQAPQTDSIRSIRDGFAAFTAAGIPVIKVLEVADSLEYAVMERVPAGFRQLSFFINHLDWFETDTEMHAALVEFARNLARFQYVGDLSGNNVVYRPDQKRWVFMDWGSRLVRHSLSEHALDDNLLLRCMFEDNMRWLNYDKRMRKLYDTLLAAMTDVRKSCAAGLRI